MFTHISIRNPVVGFKIITGLLICLPGLVAAEGDVLSLNEAEQIALDLDPMTRVFTSRAEAFDEQAVAEGQLPDPKFKLGTMNLPVNTFDLDQEPMTQLQVGLSQSFPPGRTLQYRREYSEALSDIETAREYEQALKVLREVRIRYLELYYRIQAEKILQQNRALFEELRDTTQRQYAAGRDNQHDVLRAQLELSLVDDRILEVIRAQEAARGDLAKYLTIEQSGRPIPDDFPELPALPPETRISEGLQQHPLVRIEDAAVEASKKKINEAEEKYKPGFNIDVTYGNRFGTSAPGVDRPDMLSAMVMVDLPLFTGKRQDKRVAAARKQSLAMQFARTDRIYDLTGMLEREYANWERLNDRLELYEQRAISDARLNAESTLNAYQSDTADFTTLMRAQLLELNTQLDLLRVRVERARVKARLLYLTGEI